MMSASKARMTWSGISRSQPMCRGFQGRHSPGQRGWHPALQTNGPSSATPAVSGWYRWHLSVRDFVKTYGHEIGIL